MDNHSLVKCLIKEIQEKMEAIDEANSYSVKAAKYDVINEMDSLVRKIRVTARAMQKNDMDRALTWYNEFNDLNIKS
jgi:hypothetical protein